MEQKAPGTALAVRSTEMTAQDFLPVLDIQQAVDRRNAIVDFTKRVMIENVDYGKIPGVDKPTLLQPGAEKLIALFGLTPVMECVDKIEDWTGREHGGEPFFYYRFRCTMKRGERVLGVEEASNNSWESKYRYRWVPEDQVPPHMDKTRLLRKDSSISEFEFAVAKAELSGPYGKPAAYWQRFAEAIASKTAVLGSRQTKTGKAMPAWTIPAIAYRIPNPDVADVVNTVLQMSEKRAKTRATRSCTGASEFFTQDVEDMDIIDVTPTKVSEPKPNAKPEPKPTSESPDPGADQGKPPAEKAADGFREDEAILTLKEAGNMADLTNVFNRLPVDSRRPGTACFKVFSARRDELTKGKKT